MNNLEDQLTRKNTKLGKKNTRKWGESREPYLKGGRNSLDFCLSVISNHFVVLKFFYCNLEPMTFPVKNHHYSEVNSILIFNFFVWKTSMLPKNLIIFWLKYKDTDKNTLDDLRSERWENTNRKISARDSYGCGQNNGYEVKIWRPQG